jgi:hypothetical protein
MQWEEVHQLAVHPSSWLRLSRMRAWLPAINARQLKRKIIAKELILWADKDPKERWTRNPQVEPYVITGAVAHDGTDVFTYRLWVYESGRMQIIEAPNTRNGSVHAAGPHKEGSVRFNQWFDGILIVDLKEAIRVITHTDPW